MKMRANCFVIKLIMYYVISILLLYIFFLAKALHILHVLSSRLSVLSSGLSFVNLLFFLLVTNLILESY